MIESFPNFGSFQRHRAVLSWLFGFLVLLSVVLVASRPGEIDRFAALARQAQPVWLLAAIGLQAVTYVCAAGVWYSSLGRAGYRRNLYSLLPLGFAKLFTDQALPTGEIGGTLLVVQGMKRRGIPPGVGMAVLLIGLVSFYLAYAIAAVIGLAILAHRHSLGPATIVAVGLFSLVALGIPVLVFTLRHWSLKSIDTVTPPWVIRSLRRMPGLSGLLSAMAEAPDDILKNPYLFVGPIGLQFAIFALDAGTLWVMIRAVGAEASPAAAMAAFMMASLAATIGPIPLGLGTFEAACVAVLHIQGISIEVALTATFLLRGFTFWMPMTPGLISARRELQPTSQPQTNPARTKMAFKCPPEADDTDPGERQLSLMADKAGSFWSRTAAELTTALTCSSAGLSSKEAARRLRQTGKNVVADARVPSGARLFLRQFESPLVIILIFGAAVSLLLRDWTNAGIILAIVAGSTLLAFSQEYRASTAVSLLKNRLALTSSVLRDGTEQTISASTLVPGDIVLLSAGNLIPADGLILEARDFLVSEASLTGESFPVEKRPGTVPPDAPLAARINAVFLGASVRSGMAKVLVVATGRKTIFGDIAASLAARPAETDFQRGVRQFGYLLIRVMVIIILFVLTMNQLLGRPFVESLLFAVALAVGLSPELLPAIVSVTLSKGARAMAEQGVIVRHLEAIEDLGSMDILCTDKTGTLTEGAISLDSAVDTNGIASPAVLKLAFLNATFETGIANPLDAAIVDAGRRANLTTAGWSKVDEIPYDFRRKRLTIVAREKKKETGPIMITKGAFTNVLSLCSSMRVDDRIKEITPQLRAGIENFYETKSIAGFRILALATGQPPAAEHYSHSDEAELTLEGFLLFFDPPKADMQQTIADLRCLGIRTKIISGDNRHVSAHLAEIIGLDSGALLTGDRIAELKDEALWHLAPKTDLFVEVDPQQKERIVRALQRTGHAVGFLGDGINDAPALHAADVGISVQEAVDVARESADIVLLKRDLGVLKVGVENGRRTFANTLKYISITTSANFGNMISMALATPALPFLPLAAKQILLNNFLSDLPSIALSTDKVDREQINDVQRWDVGRVRKFMIVFGLVSSVFDLLTFSVLLLILHSNQAQFQTTWFVISVLTELGVVLVLRTRRPTLKSKPGRLLLWATVLTSLAALAMPFVGPIAKAFGFTALSSLQFGLVALIVVGYIAVTEIIKSWFYRGEERQQFGLSDIN